MANEYCRSTMPEHFVHTVLTYIDYWPNIVQHNKSEVLNLDSGNCISNRICMLLANTSEMQLRCSPFISN